MYKTLLIVLSLISIASSQSITFVNALPQTATLTVQGQNPVTLSTGQTVNYNSASGVTVNSVVVGSTNLLPVPTLITPTGSGFTTVGIVQSVASGSVTLPFFDDGNNVVASGNNAIVKVVSFVNTTIAVNYVTGGQGPLFSNVAYLQQTNYVVVPAGSTFSIFDSKTQQTIAVSGSASTAQNAYSVYYLPGSTANTAELVFDRVANVTSMTTASMTSGSTTSAITSGSTSAAITSGLITSGSTSAAVTSGAITSSAITSGAIVTTTGAITSSAITSGASVSTTSAITSGVITTTSSITSSRITTSRITSGAVTTGSTTTSTSSTTGSSAVKNVIGLALVILSVAFAL